MAIGDGTGVHPHNLVRMAELQKYFWTEPRSFDGQDEDHNPRAMDGDSQAMYCSPLLRGSRRPEAQGNAPETVSVDSDVDPFADWQNSPPVTYPDCVENGCCKSAYLLGRSEGMEQQFKNLLPAIDQAIEIAMR